MPSPPADRSSAPVPPPPAPFGVASPPPPPSGTPDPGRRRRWLVAAGVAAVVAGGLVAARATGGDSDEGAMTGSGATADCIPTEPVTATVDEFSVTPIMDAVPGIAPEEIPQQVEVHGTMTNTSGVEMSAGVQVPMISYPDLMVYSSYVHLAPGETAEYTAASTLMQGGPAVPLNPDSTALVVDWTQLGDAALPRCDR